jgi:hypothetical protein
MIRIVRYSEAVDSVFGWGRMTSSSDAKVIHTVLKKSKEFNDNMVFEGPGGEVYYIDDLVGEEVTIEGYEPFTVES